MGQAVQPISYPLKQFQNKVLQRKSFSCLHQPLRKLELLYYTTSDATKKLNLPGSFLGSCHCYCFCLMSNVSVSVAGSLIL